MIRRLYHEIRNMFEPERRIWLIFAAVFTASQAFSLSELFPDYSIWERFGFPIYYYSYSSGIEYAYLNVISLFADMVIIYVITWIGLFWISQFTKYKIVKLSQQRR
ncbi:MAG: hypothetical protein J7K54_03460 [Candidatus Aenigmarchaeota archaeon]|nr:hypothetical protein [Candidatus Aenigmarchaeota archaeon]